MHKKAMKGMRAMKVTKATEVKGIIKIHITQRDFAGRKISDKIYVEEHERTHK